MRLLRREIDGEISPERLLLGSEIPVTSPEVESQVTPRNLHGELDSFHVSRKFAGSSRVLFKCSSAWACSSWEFEIGREASRRRVFKRWKKGRRNPAMPASIKA